MLQLGTSPLHLAAQYGHYSTAEVLLRAGVSRDARTKVDRTPLHMAASAGHANIVEVLVKVWLDKFYHSMSTMDHTCSCGFNFYYRADIRYFWMTVSVQY